MVDQLEGCQLRLLQELAVLRELELNAEHLHHPVGLELIQNLDLQLFERRLCPALLLLQFHHESLEQLGQSSHALLERLHGLVGVAFQLRHGFQDLGLELSYCLAGERLNLERARGCRRLRVLVVDLCRSGEVLREGVLADSLAVETDSEL